MTDRKKDEQTQRKINRQTESQSITVRYMYLLDIVLNECLCFFGDRSGTKCVHWDVFEVFCWNVHLKQ